MKAILLICILICPTLIFEGGEYYDGYGVVFPTSYSPSFLRKSFKKAVLLTGCDIERTEEIISSQLVESLSKQPNLDWVFSETPKEFFWNYNRQYYGYENFSNDTIIVVNLLNFNKRRRAEKLFSEWKSEFIVGSGIIYERNMMTLKINNTKEKIIFFPND